MRTDTHASVKTAVITQGALTIALIFVSFLLFRGAVNILNAFFVPLVLYFYSIRKRTGEIIAVDCVLAYIFMLLAEGALVGGESSFTVQKIAASNPPVTWFGRSRKINYTKK